MDDCIFCKIVNNTEKSWTAYENSYVKAFFDAFPASAGHTLIVPKNHYENIYDIPEKDLLEVMKAAKMLAKHYKKVLNIDNVQIFQSSGKYAQQDVFHFHLHIVPRHKNDGIDLFFKPRPELREKFDELLTEIIRK